MGIIVILIALIKVINRFISSTIYLIINLFNEFFSITFYVAVLSSVIKIITHCHIQDL